MIRNKKVFVYACFCIYNIGRWKYGETVFIKPCQVGRFFCCNESRLSLLL